MKWQELHRFWFGNIALTNEYYQRQMNRWFEGTYPKFDWVCQNEFAPWLTQLREIPQDLSPSDYLAMIILFDQIPRNCFREDKRAFYFDHIAQDLSLNAIDTDIEKALSLPERIFLYLPLEHSEDLELQNLSVEKFFELHKSAPTEIQSWTWMALNYAIEHQTTIKKFGRFPHRDKMRNYSSEEAGAFSI